MRANPIRVCGGGPTAEHREAIATCSVALGAASGDSMRGLAGTVGALFLALATTHCSSLESAADTFCTVNSCIGVGPSNDPDGGATAVDPVDAASDAGLSPWWCEGNGVATTTVTPPTYPADAMPSTVRYVVAIVDFGSVAANPAKPQLVDPRDIVIIACPGDVCPDAGGALTTLPPSAALPAYQIEVPYGFTGSMLITNSPSAPAGAPVYIPTDYFFGGPLVGTRQADGTPLRGPDGTPLVVGIPITPITYSTLNTFVPKLGTGPLDMTKGLLVARLLDCNGNRASGVLLNVTNPTGTGYTLYGDYEPVPGPVVTDSHGVSGYANMDGRNYELSASTPDGATYGQTTVASMHANTLTEVEVRTDSMTLQVGR